MLQKTTLLKFLLFQILLFSLASFNLVSAQMGPNDDFDGDGIINSVDIDDDNDGVLDIYESQTICGYPSQPFTSLEQARANVKTAGVYYFNLSGNTFSTYVDANGYVLIGVDYSDSGNVSLPTSSALGLVKATNGRGLLSTAALTGLGTIERIRISSNSTSAGGLDITSADATLIARIKANQTLHKGLVDNTLNSTWTGTNAGFLTGASCNAASGTTLNVNIVHTCGNTTGMHWIPSLNNQRISYTAGQIPAANYFALWVRGNTTGTSCYTDTDGDGVPNQFDLDSDGDGCPDAVESGATRKAGAGNTSTGTLVNTSGTTANVANARVGNGLPASYGSNGFYNGIESDDTQTATYTGTYTYDYALSPSYNCTDTDADGVPDVFDIDDDNDGVLDTTECSIPNTTPSNVANAFFNYSNVLDSKAGTIEKPAYIQSISDWTAGSGITTTTISGRIDLSAVAATSLATAITNSEYLEHQFVTTSDNYNWFYYVSMTAYGQAYHWAVQISSDNFATATTLNSDMSVNTTSGNKYFDITDFLLQPSTTYKIRTYFWGNPGTFSFDDFRVYGYSECDTDNDGVPNRLDLDSDGDSCPDAVESGAVAQAGAGNTSTGTLVNTSGTTANVANARVGNGLPASYGSNGFYNGIESDDTQAATYTGMYTYYNYALSQSYNCTDTDLDGVPDVFDLDDDNDGILDAYESPDCYYSAADATSNATVKISTALASTTVNSVTVVVDADIATMHNGTISAVATDNHVFPASALASTSSVIYNVAYPLPVGLTQMVVNTDTPNWGTGYFAVLEGSIDNISYNTLSAPLDISNNTGTLTANQKVWNVTLNTSNLYSYYRIRVSTKPAASSATFRNFEVTGIVNMATYIPSANPKLTCSSDTDGDGLLNHQDLDRDGDGCSDAVEGGGSFTNANLVTSSINGGNTGPSYTGSSTTPVQQNLGNTVGNASTTMGVPTIAGTGQTVLISDNKNYQSCTDFDGDGISDFDDIDDDNDGVLDIIESPTCFDMRNTNDLFTITSGLTSPDDNQADNDIQVLHNGSQTDFNFRFSNGQTYNNALIFMLDFQYAANISAIAIYSSGTWPSSSGKLQGSNDKISWTELSAYQALTGAISPKNLSVTQNGGSYKYYRILGSGLEVNTSVLISEVTTTATPPILSIAFPKPNCNNDTDGDGYNNHQDTDSDGDGCSDAKEAGVVDYVTANGGTYSSGTLTNTTVTASPYATVGNNSPAAYGTNGFYNGIENNDTAAAAYLGTYTYASAINAAISACFCYRPAVTAGTVLDTKQGITSLQRAGVDNDNWPMVRKGAWTALESKTKGFVPNRLTNQQITDIPPANLVEGMMVYNISSDCLYINTDGTPAGWKCFNTQTCPN
ncbi:hypothetical protein [Chryseobacterium sp. 18068]|uniref:hypothetical protein n=1 Tax=Chryseobacterium sp. 18068 TaxID=2681414 RepID=UPI00135A17A7|nr:hypothetical protein [Chryseobacterium sp. 18068]